MTPNLVWTNIMQFFENNQGDYISPKSMDIAGDYLFTALVYPINKTGNLLVYSKQTGEMEESYKGL